MIVVSGWTRSARWRILAVSVGFVLAAGRDAHAIPACTVANISAQDAGCPNSQAACNITKVFEVGSTIGAGCDTLDFGTRAVSITASGEFDLGSGMLTIKAASLTLLGGAQINGRGTGATPPLSQGGLLTIQTTGAVDLQRSGNNRGNIDLSGNLKGGTILIIAGGPVTISGRLQLDALTGDGSGGIATVRSGGNFLTNSLSTVEAFGRTLGTGGVFDITATGNLNFNDGVDVSGGISGGSLDLFATGQMVLQRVDAGASGESGAGGTLSFLAGGALLFAGPVISNGHTSGGCGGSIDAQSMTANLVIADDMRAEGASPDGAGGDVDIDAGGSVTVTAGHTVSTRSNGQQGCAGELSIDADLDINMAGILDASANAANSIDLNADRDIVITGPVRADGAGSAATGGDITIAAGNTGKGRLSVSNDVNVSGGPCGVVEGCGEAGTTDLNGCDIVISTSGAVLAGGPMAGQNAFTARETLTIQGRVDAHSTATGAIEGTNLILRRSDRPAALSGNITPPASQTTVPVCTVPDQKNCLVPCPTCGNGVVEFPENCDTAGAPQSCDGCSILCRTEPAGCNDGQTCTTDVCSPNLLCGHISVPGCVECRLDVDRNNVAEVATDIVYIARRKLSLAPVPPSFRVGHPEIPTDAAISATVDLLGTALDVDRNGIVEVATDIVYIARRRLSLAPVPPSFRVGHPEIPADSTIGPIIDSLCPPN